MVQLARGCLLCPRFGWALKWGGEGEREREGEPINAVNRAKLGGQEVVVIIMFTLRCDGQGCLPNLKHLYTSALFFGLGYQASVWPA